ncbi:MAG TPA: AMP-binding protein, partial [Acidimicrobiales bacterium]|nr:AMP-binding protein [Acidimicrobiales bacterium]
MNAAAGGLHQLFEEQARLVPDAPAVRFDGREVTYRTLDERADAIAHQLRALRLGRETVVGIRLERSITAVAAQLAVWKAGASYVFLDPTYPPERQRHVLVDASVALLVVGSVAPEESMLPVLRLDGDRQDRDRPVVNQGIDVRPDDRAYITYTSGSTGRPKGVESLHRGAVNYLTWLRWAGHVTRTDRALQLAPLSFDASVRDIFGPLATGGCVVLVPDRSVRDPAALADTIEREGVTCLLAATPSTLELLCAYLAAKEMSLSTLQRVLVSGEPLRRGTVCRARRWLGDDVVIVNHYGPTECTMTSTFERVDEAGPDTAIAVGRAIANVTVHVL